MKAKGGSSFQQLQDDGVAEHVRLARSKSWSTIELANVPLPAELASNGPQCATEASLAQEFQSRWSSGEGRGVLSTIWAFCRCRIDAAAGLSSEESENRIRVRCLRSLSAQWRKFPILHWGPRYSRALLRADMLAGITVGVVLIPQGVAYAMLAELPPIYGAACHLHLSHDHH